MATYDDDEHHGKNNKTKKSSKKDNDQSKMKNEDLPKEIHDDEDSIECQTDDDDYEDMKEINHEDNDNENENKQKSSTKNKSESNHKKDKKKSSSSNSDTNKKSPARDPKHRFKKVDLTRTRYLWVSGVPVGTKSTQLEELFSKYAKVLAIKIIRGGNNSLLGFVKLESHDQAQRCLDELNKTEFRGSKIELLKERPVEKDDGKKTEKIGFTNIRKHVSKSLIRPKRSRHSPSSSSHRSSRSSYHRPLSSKIPRNSHPIRLSSSSSSRNHRSPSNDHKHHRISSIEREESSRLEIERQKLEMERLRLEQEKAELFKIERISKFDCARDVGNHIVERRSISPSHRIRSSIKRVGAYDDSAQSAAHELKSRYDDFDNKRHDSNSNRRYDSRSSPPVRKIISRKSFGSIDLGRSTYESNSRSDHRYLMTTKNWPQPPAPPSLDSWMNVGGVGRSINLNSGINTNDNRLWDSSSYDQNSSSRLLSSSIGVATGIGGPLSSRLNHSDSIIQPRNHGTLGVGYHNNNRRY